MLQATYGNLHYLRKWFKQCNLSCLNLTPHTITYLLILYLQSTYPKIANLIQILFIVCRALGCFKGALVKGLRLMSYKLVPHTGPDLTDARPQANPLVRTLHPLLRGKKWKASIYLRKPENYALKVRSLKSSQSLLKCPRSLRLLLPSTQKR